MLVAIVDHIIDALNLYPTIIIGCRVDRLLLDGQFARCRCGIVVARSRIERINCVGARISRSIELPVALGRINVVGLYGAGVKHSIARGHLERRRYLATGIYNGLLIASSAIEENRQIGCHALDNERTANGASVVVATDVGYNLRINTRIGRGRSA